MISNELLYLNKEKAINSAHTDMLQLHLDTTVNGSGERILNPEDIRNNPNRTFYSKSTWSDIEPEETFAARLIRTFQDKFRVLKDVQDNIIKAGGKVDESNDTYLAEELHYGKTENDLTSIKERHIEPLARLLSDYGITRDQLDDYLYARHARERNEYIANINKNDKDLQDGGSGMTNAEADKILRKVKASGQQAKYDRLAGIIDNMLAERRELLKNAGLQPKIRPIKSSPPC